jgi:phosphohistidine swiveling domain-containing protein
MMLFPAYGMSFYEFDDERDIASYGVLMCDKVHCVPPMTPLYFYVGWYWYTHGIRYAAETLCLPTSKGWDTRIVNGYQYITAIRTTHEEAQFREPLFRERIKPFIEDFDGVWEPLKRELLDSYSNLKKARGMDKWEDIKKLSNIDLLTLMNDFVFNVDRREAEIHMLMMVATYYLFGSLQKTWRELFGMEAAVDPEYQALMAGFDSKQFQVDKLIWNLGNRVRELGLEDVFLSIKDNEQILAKLEENEAGIQWLKEYKHFLEENGWRCLRMQEYNTPAWVEKPSVGIGTVRLSIGKRGYRPDEERERLIKKREEAERRVIERIPEGKRDWFRVLLKAGQKAGYWSEDHTYYSDFYISAIGRWIFAEYGRRFAGAGCINDPDDVYFLLPDDIRKAAIPMGMVDLRMYVKQRKEAWEESHKIDPPIFLGNPDKVHEVINSDPTLTVSATQHPIIRTQLKADLYGSASTPGVAEGIARVVKSVDKLIDIKPGEILVAPGTTGAWTPVFNIIKGLICDGGGALSHPVIVAREYGIPCVIGTLEATSKIKTGQKVRVDGDQAAVYVLNE